MFLSFGKKGTSSKKPSNSLDSPKTPSTPGTSSPLNGNGAQTGSRATVQTVAGPLLASTRFNTILDASTYANVNSPGFTSRLVHCASNGSAYHEKLATHQSKYSGIGLFPRVQLEKHSTLPTLSSRNSQKVARTPVRVRIAPPSLSERRRQSISIESFVESNEKVDVLKGSPSLSCQDTSENNPAVTKPLENNSSTDKYPEASRKRIFTESQDARDEAKKRRRKSEIPIPNPNGDIYQYRHVRAPAVPASLQHDASSQGKRAREKGSPEEQKRQRRKICNTNNAIFSSLSSSRNLLERLAAQKRKSADTSQVRSSLTPPITKHVKENKMLSYVKAVQSNLDENASAANMVQDGKHRDGTPLSTRTIVKRSVESLAHERSKSLNETLNSSPCDYTTKLFRKDVPSHSPRASVPKDKKQSLWVQPPEADELSCSLLSDDSILDRPERLKSLLACVSGKDASTSKSQTVTSDPPTSGMAKETSQISLTGLSLPVSVSLKVLPPPGTTFSSALTVTVSSTSTIMTSATVTSVNGVPSSESSPPQSRPSQVPPLSSVTSPSMSQPTFGQNIVSAALPSSVLSPETNVDQVQKVSAPLASVAPLSSLTFGSTPTASSTSVTPRSSLTFGSTSAASSTSVTPRSSLTFGSTSAASSTSVTPQSSLTFGSISAASTSVAPQSSSTFGSKSASLAGSSVTSTPASGLFDPQSKASPAATSSSTIAAFSFTSNQNAVRNPTTSSSSISSADAQPTSNIFSLKSPNIANQPLLQMGPSSTNSTFQFGSSGSNFSTIAKPPQFGLSADCSSEVPKTSFQMNTNNQTSSSLLTSTSKPAFQQGGANWSSGLQNTPQASTQSQFGSNFGAVTKPTFSFGLSSTGSSDAPKPALQFGSNNSESKISAAGFQFSLNNTPQGSQVKSPFSLGSNGSSSSESTKTTFNFGSSNAIATDVSKPALSFGSTSSGTSVATKPLFGSSNTCTSGGPKSTFQFGLDNRSTSETPKSAFQFPVSAGNASEGSKPAFQFKSNPNPTADNPKSPFQNGLSQIKSNDPPKSSFQFSSNHTLNSQNFPTPTFGSPIQCASSAPGQLAPQQNKANFSFGSPAQPNTNTGSSNENKGTFSFGSSGSAFGSSSSMPTAAPFGSSNSMLAASPFGSSGTPAFGSPASNSQSTLPSFGSLQEPKTNGFGSTPSFGSPSTNSFNLNSQISAGSSFQFSNKNSTVNSSGAFSFGQKQDQTPSTFNFNGSVTAVPNGSAQANQGPGLFSIGVGSSSTQRRVREGRRRR